MYLSDLRVYFKVDVSFQSNLKWDGGVLKSQKNWSILPTLATLNLLLTRRFYSMVD